MVYGMKIILEYGPCCIVRIDIMKKLNPKVHKIAEQVRRQCRKFAMSSESIGKDYHGADDLDMMCGIASFTLEELLRRRGFKAKIIVGLYTGCYHCWVEWRGWIIDITATQYGIKEGVHIVNSGDGSYEFISSVHDDYDWDGWAFSQAPTTDLANRILEY